jgi:hypothetical protein
VEEAGADTGLDFFISHAGPDAGWAEWIGQQLVEADYTVELDVWDWAAGTSFIAAMQRAVQRADRMLAVWSRTYFQRAWTDVEEQAAFVRKARRPGWLVPVLVEACEDVIPDIHQPLIRVDLVDVTDEEQARRRLLEGLAGPTRPTRKVPFPGALGRVVFPTALPPVWNMPTRNLFFTGRDRLLSELARLLRADRDDDAAGRATALQGAGGVGKSHLALEYAWRHADDYQVAWWINADDPTGADAALVDLAAALNLPLQGGATAVAALVRAELARRYDWLLIYDNIGDLGLIRDLPETGHVIVTCQDIRITDRMPALAVGAFSRSESTAFLMRRVPYLTPADADRIAAATGDLPLALAQAAAYLASTGTSTVDYLTRLSITSRLPEDEPGTTAISSQPRPRPADGSPELAGTVTAAVDILTVNDPAALDLLHQLAFFASDPIPLTAANAATPIKATGGLVLGDPDTTAELVLAITRLDLARTSGTHLIIHRRVQMLLHDLITPTRRILALTRALRLLGTAAPGDPDDLATWPAYGELTPHLHAIADRLGEVGAREPAAFRRLLLDTCRYLYVSGQYRSGHDIARRIQRHWAGTLGEDHPDTLILSRRTAALLYGLGRYRAARTLDEDTLTRGRQLFGPDHPHTLASANNLAIALNAVGELQAARELDEDTLARRRRILGPDHPDTLQSASNLAADLSASGMDEAARALGEDTLERRRRVLGPDHPATLISAKDLARYLSTLGMQQAARVLAEDTLKRQRQLLGPDHPHTLFTASNLAVALRALGEYQQARELDEDTLARRRRILGPDHPDTLASADNLASDLSALGVSEAVRTA